MSTVIALFGYGTNKLYPQTKRRCEKAAELLKNSTAHSIYITGAGAGQMKECLLSQGIASESVIIDPRALTTAAEIRIFNEIIPDGSSIIAISSWYHLPRISIIWKAFDQKVTTVPAYGNVSIYDLVREALAIPVTAIFPKIFCDQVSDRPL